MGGQGRRFADSLEFQQTHFEENVTPKRQDIKLWDGVPECAQTCSGDDPFLKSKAGPGDPVRKGLDTIG